MFSQEKKKAWSGNEVQTEASVFIARIVGTIMAQ